jgi:hypothetical protein
MTLEFEFMTRRGYASEIGGKASRKFKSALPEREGLSALFVGIAATLNPLAAWALCGRSYKEDANKNPVAALVKNLLGQEIHELEQ